jgi:hypothetical protein
MPNRPRPRSRPPRQHMNMLPRHANPASQRIRHTAARPVPHPDPRHLIRPNHPRRRIHPVVHWRLRLRPLHRNWLLHHRHIPIRLRRSIRRRTILRPCAHHAQHHDSNHRPPKPNHAHPPKDTHTAAHRPHENAISLCIFCCFQIRTNSIASRAHNTRQNLRKPTLCAPLLLTTNH